MSDEFDMLEEEGTGGSSFETKKFFTKLIKYWKLFLLLLIAGVIFVYQKNIREEFSYRLGTKISIEEDSNPLFTSNASLTFNWGGVTSKVQTMLVTLKSRSHHEKVIERLQYYKSYLQQGRFRKNDIYKAANFRYNHDIDKPQLLNTPIKITFLDSLTYELEVEFIKDLALVQNYKTKRVHSIAVEQGIYKKQFQVFEKISLPFMAGVIMPIEKKGVKIGTPYFIQFSDFDTTVASYNGRLSIKNTNGSPILDITLIDKNTHKIVDYLNTVVEVLSEEQLNRKNQYATNTIAFIDEQLLRVKSELSGNAEELNNYKREQKIFGLSDENIILNDKLTSLDNEKSTINSQLNYYNNLKNYLITSSNFTDIPAPSIAGIDDSNILGNVSKINELSVEKSKLQYSVRQDARIFDDLNRQIEGLKKVLLENISSVADVMNNELRIINSKLYNLEEKFNKLPEQQQKLLTIQRQYALSEQTYNVFLAKRGEAEIIKASNVSDILIIDPAKNTGATVLGRNLNVRYIFAFFISLFIPLIIAFILTYLDDNISSPKDIEELSNIPILGVIGENISDDDMVVHRKPKSVVAEAFRSIRSNLQYFYKSKALKGAKTLMITSSVSGEGKTFCSINIATVFALGGKKTVLLGLDLRKPKIYGTFDVKNEKGVVNYLIGQEFLDGIIQKTEVEHLDLITSGPTPPNPSELLISSKLEELISDLKTKYDYIILDTPPLGLVSDALELLDYVDVSLYVVRQDYTKKPMLDFINEKHRSKQIQNISLLYNGYNQKTKYGYGNGYGYGYGYYAKGYLEDLKPKQGVLSRLKRFLKI